MIHFTRRRESAVVVGKFVIVSGVSFARAHSSLIYESLSFLLCNGSIIISISSPVSSIGITINNNIHSNCVMILSLLSFGTFGYFSAAVAADLSFRRCAHFSHRNQQTNHNTSLSHLEMFNHLPLISIYIIVWRREGKANNINAAMKEKEYGWSRNVCRWSSLSHSCVSLLWALESMHVRWIRLKKDKLDQFDLISIDSSSRESTMTSNTLLFFSIGSNARCVKFSLQPKC